MSTLTRTHRTAAHRVEPKGILAALVGFQDVWRQRKALSEMDSHLRDDLGLTEADVQTELRRPFWDAPRTWRR